MSVKNGSAEVFAITDARLRLRAGDAPGETFSSVGAFLAATRNAAGLTVQDVAARTRVKAAFLEAIEEGDRAALPAIPFAVGFVKTYAEALGLDPEKIAARFKDETGVRPVQDVDRAVEAANAASSAEAAPRPEMSLLAVVAVLIFIIWCAFQLTRPRDAVEQVRPPMFPAASGGVRGDFEAHGAGAEGPAALASLQLTLGNEGAAEGLPVLEETRLIDRVEPVYPHRCEAGAGPVETVEIGFTVTVGGDVVGERVVAASDECFGRSALNAVRRWRFEPRRVDGAPRPAYEQRAVLTFDRPA